MRRWVFPGLALILVLTLLVGACAKSTPGAATKPIKLRYTGGMAPNHHMTAEQKWLAAEVGKRTNGRVTVETYIGGELYKHNEVPDAIGSGAIEMGLCSTGHYSSRNPLLGFYNYFFLLKDQEHTVRAKERMGQLFAPLLEEQNCKMIHWLAYGDSGYIGNKPIVKPADIKNKMIRGMNAETVQSLKALGAVGVSMAENEAYDAIEKGAIDGTLTGFSTMVSRKQYEVSKYVFGILFSSPWIVCINLDLWKTLPPDIQKVFLEVGKETEETSFKQSFAERAKDLEILGKINLTLVKGEQLAEWTKFARPTWDDWLQRCEKGGWGKQARELVKILDETR